MKLRHGLLWYWNRARNWLGRPRLIVQTRAVSLDDGARCSEPIFIVGPHRSGTSLVRRLFNTHREIACPPESFFIAHYAAMLDDDRVADGYQGFGASHAEMRDDLARKAASLHEAYRMATGKRIWADKTPHYSSHLDPIDRLFDRRARFIIVLRHPGDVVHSIYKRGWRFNALTDDFESALAHVRQSLDDLLAFEAAQPDRCIRIVYEDLCTAPEQVLTAALARLGLPYDPGMLDFAQKSHNFGQEDPVVRGTSTIRRQSGAWRSLSAARQQRLMEVFGSAIPTDSFWSGSRERPSLHGLPQ